MAQRSTQPLTGMYTRNISWGLLRLVRRADNLTDCLEVWEPQPPGTLRDCAGLYRDCFTLTFPLQNILTGQTKAL